MLTQDDEFARLLHRIKDGSEEAMLELVENYGAHLFRVVRRRLNRAIRPKFDSGDFVQAVWASFFENRAQCVDFASPKELIAFLAQIAHNKVIDENRRRLLLKARNVNREVPLDDSDAEKTVVSPAPTASEVVYADERLHQLTTAQSIRSRQVVELRRHGATYREIAAVLGVEQRTVQRVLERLEREVAT
jgi:RNA polymerase sigma factor (sigma-70 family)